MKKIIVVLIALLYVGCATTYKEGVKSSPLNVTGFDPNSMFMVSFRGNGYTSNSTQSKFLMLKASELALDNNKPYFAILSYEDASSVYTYYTTTSEVKARSSSTGSLSYYGGNTAYYKGSSNASATIETTTQSHTNYRPGADLVVFVFDNPNRLKPGIQYHVAQEKYLEGKEEEQAVTGKNTLWGVLGIVFTVFTLAAASAK